ncbi:MAG: hypothetical protein KBT27_09265 [Prevotellaceae bacterium]|nr:hypothetical protein [Candidatus Faecinaster equi]
MSVPLRIVVFCENRFEVKEFLSELVEKINGRMHWETSEDVYSTYLKTPGCEVTFYSAAMMSASDELIENVICDGIYIHKCKIPFRIIEKIARKSCRSTKSIELRDQPLIEYIFSNNGVFRNAVDPVKEYEKINHTINTYVLEGKFIPPDLVVKQMNAYDEYMKYMSVTHDPERDAIKYLEERRDILMEQLHRMSSARDHDEIDVAAETARKEIFRIQKTQKQLMNIRRDRRKA